MNICIPVHEDEGLHSRICAHFGSAPLFMIVDTGSESCRAVPNQNQHHGHGMCKPLASLQGESLDGMVVGGIGGGALAKLRAAGIRVYLSDLPTVETAMSAFKAGSLREVTPAEACAHHGDGPHGHGAGGPHGAGHGREARRS
jgi:predicted Fe-Mo cluster-binding NifX family protein